MNSSAVTTKALADAQENSELVPDQDFEPLHLAVMRCGCPAPLPLGSP